MAYIHDWDRAESVIAMVLGIMIYASFLTYITSLPSTQNLLQHPVIRSTIRVGTFLRMLICISPLALFPFIALYDFISGHPSQPLACTIIYTGDFLTGLLSHEFYREFVSLLPFQLSNIRQFLPTLTITIIQGFLLTGLLLLIGILLSPFHLHREQRKEHARL